MEERAHRLCPVLFKSFGSTPYRERVEESPVAEVVAERTMRKDQQRKRLNLRWAELTHTPLQVPPLKANCLQPKHRHLESF